MASVFHQIQYWTLTIPPNGYQWLSYGPDARYRTGTVQASCNPATPQGPGSTVHRTHSLGVPEIIITSIPLVQGDLVFTNTYAGFAIWNRGQETVYNFSVALSVIQP
ncbi:hypothetical protein [Actinomycetospora aeridis]|uniref:Uncharacterized protein n=1 Tax=Actinomycetospora aeridis TaxID=3129231 RepID=A0ABU8MYK8_9PSEU